MSAATLTLGFHRPSLFDDRRALPPRRPEPAAKPPRKAPTERGRMTLDALVVGAWEGLAAHHPVACPVCSGAMTPRYGSGPGPVGGRCGRCGSTLG
jgi:hypothetical protein